MKSKFIIFTASLFIAFNIQAHEITSKKGIPILPKKGDIAIGVSATPFLDFVGVEFYVAPKFRLVASLAGVWASTRQSVYQVAPKAPTSIGITQAQAL